MPLPSECQKHADKIQQLRAELAELEGGRDDAAKIARIWTAVAAAEDNLRACVRQHAPTYTTSVSYLDFSGTVMLPSRGRLLNSELNEIEAATVNNGLLSLASGSPDVPLPGPVGLVIQDSNPLATGPSFRSEVLKSIPPVSDPERIIEFAVPPPSRFSTTAMTAALAARFPASVGAPLVLGDGTSLAAIGLSVGIPAGGMTLTATGTRPVPAPAVGTIGFTFALPFTVVPSFDASDLGNIVDVKAAGPATLTTIPFEAGIIGEVLGHITQTITDTVLQLMQPALNAFIRSAAPTAVGGVVKMPLATVPQGLVISARSISILPSGVSVTASVGAFGGLVPKFAGLHVLALTDVGAIVDPCGHIRTELETLKARLDVLTDHDPRDGHGPPPTQAQIDAVKAQIAMKETELANCLPTIGVAPPTLWHVVRRPDDEWSAFLDVKGAAAAGDPGVLTDVATARTHTGNIEVVAAGKDGGLWHATRYAIGGWSGFSTGNLKQQASDPGPVTAVACAGIDDALHVCAITENGGIWHAVRQLGTWTHFGDVKGQAGDRGAATAVSCAGVGAELHVCAVTADGGLWHTLRHADGTWVAFRDVKGQAGDRGPVRAGACSGVGEDLHVCAITADGMVWHTIRRDLWLTFGNVSEVASLPPAVKDVDCSAVSDGALHVGMVDGGGRLLHAFRSPNGSWNAPPTDVESRSGERGSFGKVSMTVEPFALT